MTLWRGWWLGLGLAVGAAAAEPDKLPLYFESRLDEAAWQVEATRFRCRLSQALPVVGQAVFETRAGHSQMFYLDPRRNPFRPGVARLSAQAPHWAPERGRRSLGEAAVDEGPRPVQLDDAGATLLLEALRQGMAPALQQTRTEPPAAEVAVVLSSAGFRAAYGDYNRCLTQLLPVSFEQIARTRVQFDSGDWKLGTAARRQLDLVIRYTRADGRVTELFVDGHTDALGRRLANLDLSKKRAEAVTGYLVANGIDAERITTRYHGERYPVTDNTSEEGRARNRRVTIRLERSDV